jgi:hypothetical protein
LRIIDARVLLGWGAARRGPARVGAMHAAAMTLHTREAFKSCTIRGGIALADHWKTLTRKEQHECKR